MVAEAGMEMFSKISKLSWTTKHSEWEDRHLLMALLISRCPVCLLQPRGVSFQAVFHSRKFQPLLGFGFCNSIWNQDQAWVFGMVKMTPNQTACTE